MTKRSTEIPLPPLQKIPGKWTVVEHKNVKTEARVEDSVCTLTISNAKGANWHSELRYGPFEVQEGEEYEVSFETRAEVEYTYSVWLGQFDSPHAALIAEENHFGEEKANAEWSTRSHQWRVNRSEERSRLVFVVGPIDNVVEFRNISLSKI